MYIHVDIDIDIDIDVDVDVDVDIDIDIDIDIDTDNIIISTVETWLVNILVTKHGIQMGKAPQMYCRYDITGGDPIYYHKDMVGTAFHLHHCKCTNCLQKPGSCDTTGKTLP